MATFLSCFTNSAGLCGSCLFTTTVSAQLHVHRGLVLFLTSRRRFSLSLTLFCTDFCVPAALHATFFLQSPVCTSRACVPAMLSRHSVFFFDALPHARSLPASLARCFSFCRHAASRGPCVLPPLANRFSSACRFYCGFAVSFLFHAITGFSSPLEILCAVSCSSLSNLDLFSLDFFKQSL